MLWEIDHSLHCMTAQFENWTPAEVLYEFDGPRIFTTINAKLMYLWYECGEDIDSNRIRYLIAPTNQELIQYLKHGTKTVYDVLRQPWIWVVDTQNGKVINGWVSDLDSIPSSAKPQRHAPLWPQLEPLFCYRLIGDGLHEGQIPANVAARAINGPISALKSLFESINSSTTNIGRPDEKFRKLYAVVAKRFAFNSFEVAFDIPSELNLLEDSAKIETTSQKTADYPHEIKSQTNLPGFPSGQCYEFNQRMEIYKKGADKLNEALNWLITSDGDADIESPELNILYVLEHLVPPKHGQITAAEVRGKLIDSCHQSTKLTRSSTIKVKTAIAKKRKLQRILETKEGRIGEFDKDKLACTIRNSDSTDTICFFSEDHYDDLYDAFHNDKKVVIQGKWATDRRVLEIIAIEMLALPEPNVGIESTSGE